MYARQLQRQLERASTRSLRVTQSARLGSRASSRTVGDGSSSWGGSLDSSRHGMRRRGSLPQLNTLVEGQPAGGGSGRASAAAQQEGSAAGEAPPPPPPQQQVQQQGAEQQGAAGRPGSPECDLSVETCPAAVGASWLPALVEHLAGAKGRGAGGTSSGAGGAVPPQPGRQPTPVPSATPRRDSRVSSTSGAARRTPGSASHRTLAEVRGLFDAAESDAAESDAASDAGVAAKPS